MFDYSKSGILSDLTHFHMLLAYQEKNKNKNLFQLWGWLTFLKRKRINGIPPPLQDRNLVLSNLLPDLKLITNLS